jgi:hypothetical protein
MLVSQAKENPVVWDATNNKCTEYNASTCTWYYKVVLVPSNIIHSLNFYCGDEDGRGGTSTTSSN